MLIIYAGTDEVIVCKSKSEGDMLDDCFNKKSGRDIDDYEREEYDDFVIVSSGGMSVE